ncbi:MAG TPA: MBL fold metallo-hydrolase [Armatimonadetes bacterium]|jgi:glyoxylase-like metal-dependent hydrolase (beta-lactamase superfamily II)|nr:MBL fold metallo-hydrolase [Armatimonadota bacterium]
MAELLPGIHAIDGVAIDLAGAELRVHPLLLVEDGALTLIDAGPVGSERPIRAYIEALGFSLNDVERIIVTHHHSDHTGGLSRLAQESGAVVAAHYAEVSILERRVPEPARPVTPEGLRALGIDIDDAQYQLMRQWMASFTPPAVKVIEELQGGDMLPILGGLQVLHDTGHSPGHIALFAPQRSVLFATDLFYHNGREIHIPLPVFTQDAGNAIETLRTLVETLSFDVAIPYHGVPLMGEASEKLRHALSGVKSSTGHTLPGQVLAPG